MAITSKVTTDAQSFFRALKDSHVERKPNIPVLGYVKVSLQRVIGTDLDVTTVIDIFGQGECEGDFLVPHRQVIDVLNGEKGTLTITHERGNELIGKTGPYRDTGSVTLSINGCEYRFDSIDVTNFPVTPEVSGSPVYIDAQEFATMLERTRFAISREDSRYTLKGALLEVGNGVAVMVATDGHRLSVSEAIATGELNAIIPSDALAWLDSRAGKNGARVTVSSSKPEPDSDSESGDFVSVAMGGKQIIARKLKGQFPNWRAVMPTLFRTQVRIQSPDTLVKTLGRVAKCADERSGSIRWTFSPESSTIAAQSTDRGSAKASIDCAVTMFPKIREVSKESGEVIEDTEQDSDNVLSIGLSAPYISEFLKVAGDNPVTVTLKDKQTAALFSTGQDWKYVVMPMRL